MSSSSRSSWPATPLPYTSWSRPCSRRPAKCAACATRPGAASPPSSPSWRWRPRSGITISESELPIRAEVNGASEILGIDPIYVANEGKLVAFVAPDSADAALAALRSHPLGREAAVIAEVTSEVPGLVVLETALGGSRVVDMLAGDPLPRIC